MSDLKAKAAEIVSSSVQGSIRKLSKAKDLIRRESIQALENDPAFPVSQAYDVYKTSNSLRDKDSELSLSQKRFQQTRMVFTVVGVVLSVTKSVLLNLIQKDIVSASKTQGWSKLSAAKSIIQIVGVQALLALATFAVTAAVDRVAEGAKEKVSNAISSKLSSFDPLPAGHGVEESVTDIVDKVIAYVFKGLESLVPSTAELAKRLPSMATEQVLYGVPLEKVIDEELRGVV